MGRKHKHAAHENHERWLVSYADFMTLLFAFFVVMFATGQTDKAKAQQVSQAVQAALDKGHFTAAIAAILGGTVGEKGVGNAQKSGPGGAHKAVKADVIPEGAVVAELVPSLDKLKAGLKDEIASGKIDVKLEGRGLVVSLKEAAFFPSGQDVVLTESLAMIDKMADVVKKLPNPVRLEGHTDSVPIHNARFRSNWELSAARSIAMLELFKLRYKLDPERMAVAGYADTIPVASNDTEEGRAKNRRVDLVILSLTGVSAEPKAPPAAAAAKAAARH